MKVIIVRGKNLLWEPVVRARRGEIEVNFGGALSAKSRSTKTGDWGGWGLGKRPLLLARALLIQVNLQGWRRLGTPNGSVEERDLLDLAPVDEGGQHGWPAGGTPGRMRWLGNKREREGGQAE